MEVFTELYKTGDDLFRRVDEILRKNGLYAITQYPDGYILNFWLYEDHDHVYSVMQGKDGGPFKFIVGGDRSSGVEWSLAKGDVLIFELETRAHRNYKVWFYCLRLLIGAQATEIEKAFGFCEYGPLSTMLKKGVIKKYSSASSNNSDCNDRNKNPH